MKVVLKGNLFTPIGRFRKTLDARYPDTLPDEVRPFLPKSAVVIEDAAEDNSPTPEDDVGDTFTAYEKKTGKGASVKEFLSKPK